LVSILCSVLLLREQGEERPFREARRLVGEAHAMRARADRDAPIDDVRPRQLAGGAIDLDAPPFRERVGEHHERRRRRGAREIHSAETVVKDFTRPEIPLHGREERDLLSGEGICGNDRLRADVESPVGDLRQSQVAIGDLYVTDHPSARTRGAFHYFPLLEG
jgi:hypothetical protein